MKENVKNNQDETVLVERAYKGQYERFALTIPEFKEIYPEVKAIDEFEAGRYTLKPMVHIWFSKCKLGGENWNRFFSDMTMGIPESDIEEENFAYIRKDLAKSLAHLLPETPEPEPKNKSSEIKNPFSNLTVDFSKDTQYMYISTEEGSGAKYPCKTKDDLKKAFGKYVDLYIE